MLRLVGILNRIFVYRCQEAIKVFQACASQIDFSPTCGLVMDLKFQTRV